MVDIPWASLSGLKEEAERIVNDCLGKGLAGRFPLWDLIERPGEFILLAELAGVAPDSVGVSLAGSTLTVSGERVQEPPEPGEAYHIAERSYGPFSRSVNIPAGVESDAIRAEFHHGILRVRLPKSAAPGGRKIPVEQIL